MPIPGPFPGKQNRILTAATCDGGLGQPPTMLSIHLQDPGWVPSGPGIVPNHVKTYIFVVRSKCVFLRFWGRLGILGWICIVDGIHIAIEIIIQISQIVAQVMRSIKYCHCLTKTITFTKRASFLQENTKKYVLTRRSQWAKNTNIDS